MAAVAIPSSGVPTNTELAADYVASVEYPRAGELSPELVVSHIVVPYLMGGSAREVQKGITGVTASDVTAILRVIGIDPGARPENRPRFGEWVRTVVEPRLKALEEAAIAAAATESQILEAQAAAEASQLAAAEAQLSLLLAIEAGEEPGVAAGTSTGVTAGTSTSISTGTDVSGLPSAPAVASAFTQTIKPTPKDTGIGPRARLSSSGKFEVIEPPKAKKASPLLLDKKKAKALADKATSRRIADTTPTHTSAADEARLIALEDGLQAFKMGVDDPGHVRRTAAQAKALKRAGAISDEQYKLVSKLLGEPACQPVLDSEMPTVAKNVSESRSADLAPAVLADACVRESASRVAEAVALERAAPSDPLLATLVQRYGRGPSVGGAVRAPDDALSNKTPWMVV